jgi:hypothetical protein
MIDAFELLQPHLIVYSEDRLIIDEGLDLFHKYFFNLWD